MNFKKIAAGIMICLMSSALFGCELVSVNKQRDNEQVVITVGETNYTKEVISGMTESVLSMYGIKDAKASTYDEYRMEMAKSFAEQKALNYYAIQNGYKDRLTEEDNKEIDEAFEEAKKYYNEDIYNEVKKEQGYTDEEGAPEFDEGAKSKVERETANKQKDYLMTLGVSNLDDYKNVLIDNKAGELYSDSLKNSVNISDEEVKNHYDSMVNKQKSSYESNSASYVDDTEEGSSATVVYVPSGFRRVKHILIKIDDEASSKIKALESEINALEDGEEKTNKQSELDILKKDAYGKIQQKANEALNQAKSGEDFDQLISKYGEDEGAKTNTEGYLMHASVTDKYVENFQTAGMALEKVGDISELVETEYGYHIMLYASDVQGGQIAFDKVKDKVKEEALEEKRTKAVSDKTTEILDNYKADGTVKLYHDRLKTASVPGKN